MVNNSGSPRHQTICGPEITDGSLIDTETIICNDLYIPNGLSMTHGSNSRVRRYPRWKEVI